MLQLFCSVATIERVRETRNKSVHIVLLGSRVVQQLCRANTTAFFLRVNCASILPRNHISKVQVLSWHSFLNSHQFRFGFRDSFACGCGSLYESLEHFLFFAPDFYTKDLFSEQPVAVVTSFGLLFSRPFQRIRLFGKKCAFY